MLISWLSYPSFSSIETVDSVLYFKDEFLLLGEELMPTPKDFDTEGLEGGVFVEVCCREDEVSEDVELDTEVGGVAIGVEDTLAIVVVCDWSDGGTEVAMLSTFIALLLTATGKDGTEKETAALDDGIGLLFEAVVELSMNLPS